MFLVRFQTTKLSSKTGEINKGNSDNFLHNGGSLATDGCNMPCNGNATQICGGPNRLSVFVFGNGNVTTAPSATATATTPAPTIVATALPTGWAYRGCYSEGTEGRALLNQQPDSQSNTVENCVATCVGLSYGIAGLEFGAQCFCDNFVHNGAAAAAESDCNMACPGNTGQNCGAGMHASIQFRYLYQL